MPDPINLRQGSLVRFAHEHNGGPVHKIVSVMSDGMVELHDMGGYFAPHLFSVADDIGGIPCSRSPEPVPATIPDVDVDAREVNLSCPFCGGDVDPEGWLQDSGFPDDPSVQTRGPECTDCGSTAPNLTVWNRRRTAAEIRDINALHAIRQITDAALAADVSGDRSEIDQIVRRALGNG